MPTPTAPDKISEAPTDEIPAASTSPLPPILTVPELAALLRINKKTAYEAIRLGEIPGVRHIRGAIRIHRDTVLEWLGKAETRIPRPRRKP